MSFPARGPFDRAMQLGTTLADASFARFVQEMPPSEFPTIPHGIDGVIELAVCAMQEITDGGIAEKIVQSFPGAEHVSPSELFGAVKLGFRMRFRVLATTWLREHFPTRPDVLRSLPPKIVVRSVTPDDLGRLVRRARESGLNRSPDWRVEEGKAYIEYGYRPHTISVEVRPDRAYFLRPVLLHHHRRGQPTEPHWRCWLYETTEGRHQHLEIPIDVFVADYDRLLPLGS